MGKFFKYSIICLFIIISSIPYVLIGSEKYDIEEIYTKFTDVNNNFLEFNENFSQSLHETNEKFKSEYSKKIKSTLNITNFSSRARIYLLKEIIDTKISKLPKNFNPPKNKKFTAHFFPTNGFWQKIKDKFYATDLFPTTFQIGQYEYNFYCGPTPRQKGSGSILGLIQIGKGENYKEIIKFLKLHEANFEEISAKLRNQKKDGQPIQASSPDIERFLNGFNLLLDYEVARRRVSADTYSDVPILTSIDYLLKNFNHKNLNDFFFCLFSGEKREEFVKNNLLSIQITQENISHSQSIRGSKPEAQKFLNDVFKGG